MAERVSPPIGERLRERPRQQPWVRCGACILAVFWAMLMTALLGILFERLLWGPMRTKHAGFLQLILMSIGLAFVLRAVVQWFWGTEIRVLDVNRTDTVDLLGLRIGQMELIVVIVGVGVLLVVGLMLKLTILGKQM